MNKRLNLLYFSATDTTAKVVKSVASAFDMSVNKYDVTLPENRLNPLDFESEDILIVGVPVYSGRVPEFLSEYFSNVKGDGTIAVFIVVYGNRAYDDALLELKDIFEKNGFMGIAAGAFVGEHSYNSELAGGRPDQNDLDIAYRFGLEIKDKLNRNTINKLRVYGKFPYRDRGKSQPVQIETEENCTNCGICAAYCPMGAIRFDNFKVTDSTKCIKCCSCIKRCPVHAREIRYEPHIKLSRDIVEKYGSIRLEPEFFL